MNPTQDTNRRGGALRFLTGRRSATFVAAGLALLLAVETVVLNFGPAGVAFAATGTNTEDRGSNLLDVTGLSATSGTTPALLVGTPEEPDVPLDPIPMPDDLPAETAKPADLAGAEGGAVTLDLDGMQVEVAAPDGGNPPEEVVVGVADPTTAQDAGVTAGVLLTVTDTPEAPAEPGQSVELTVSYEDFSGLAGGDWESRLQAVWIPDCADTTDPACLPISVESDIDPTNRTVTLEVPVTQTADPAPVSTEPAPTPTTEPTPTDAAISTESASPTELPATDTSNSAEPADGPRDTLTPAIPQAQSALGTPSSAVPAAETGTASGAGAVALTAGVAGPQGDWSATGLAPSAAWSVSGSTGSFTWSYPMRVPKAAAGPAPELTIGYSSGAVDGRVPSTNNQAGPVGEGFDLGTSFIERSYTSCSKDETAGANNIGKSAPDLCWGKDNATLSLAGAGSELVKDSAGVWRPRNDDGTRVEHLTSGGAEGEYWRVTTTDGTQYLFGSQDTARSAWKVPVYGNHPGEKCHGAAFASSQCSQVWRWNLDRVIDPSGNTASYFYTPETNSYRPFYGSGNLAYTAGGRLDRIEYGTRNGLSVTAPAKVEFTNSPRCITDLAQPDSWCTTSQSSTASHHWLDTPIDLICEAAAACTTYAPTFFNRTRLAKIQTYADAGDGYEPADSWTLSQRFSPQGTGISLHTAKGVMLQLAQIEHDAQGGDALTDVTSIPAVKFDYTDLANRVGKPGEAHDALYRPRVHSIRTEAGGRITVAYQSGCANGIPSDPATNTDLCFPVKWERSGDSSHWFHKYLVKTITEGHTQIDPGTAELSTGSLAKITNYSYGPPVWAKPDSPMIPDAERTWSEFRGTRTVTTTLGEVGSADTRTTTTYYVGDGKTLTGGPGGAVTATDDHRFTGQPFKTVTYNDTTPVSETVTKLTSKVTGVSVLDASYTAVRADTETTHQYTFDRNGTSVLHAESRTEYNAYGQPTQVDDFGKVGNTDDNLCTTTSYAHETNTSLRDKHLVALPAITETTSKACDATDVVRPRDVVTAARTTYDAAGRPTKVEPIDPSDGTGYAPPTTSAYDALGRVTSVTDAGGNTTTTAYTPAGAGLLQSQVVTNPLGHTATTVFDPVLGLPKSTVDANERTTTATYDGLGRLLTVRYPQHANSTHPSIAYEYTVKPNGLNAVVTKTISADGATQRTSSVLYDALMRPFQTQKDAPTAAGGRAVTATVYDDAGRITEQTNQWWAKGQASASPIVKPADTSGTTTFAYDKAGRQTDSIFWIGTPSNAANEKWRTTTRYDGLTTLTVPPIGGVPVATSIDARGRTTTLAQYHRDPETQKDKDTPDEVVNLTHTDTTYTYTPAGQLASMTDTGTTVNATEKNTWEYGYDWAGRQTSANDPDAGATTTTYDVLGRVTTRTNGNGDTLGYTYDALGRQTSLRDLPAGVTNPAEGVERATWTYDTTLKGTLASSTRKISDTETYTTRVDRWDAAYRPTQTSVVLPEAGDFLYLGNRTLTTKHSYTVDGQAKTTTYPAVTKTLPTGTPPTTTTILPEETVTTVYDQASSQPAWMSGGFGWGVYVASSGFDYQGRPTYMDLGNTYGNVVSYRYENGTGRLQNIRLDRERIEGTELDVAYTYDPAGNVTSLKDRPTNIGLAADAFRDQQCFGYDELVRLEQAWAPKTGDCNSIPATMNMGGAAPYWNEYEHDLLGNRTKLTTRTTAGVTTTTTNTYGAGDAGPHQVTTSNTGGAATTFEYDDAGNRTTKTTGTTATTYEWDVEGELTGVGTTKNVYDADGNRLVRKDTTGTTIYAGGQEVLINPAGDVKATRYYTYAGTTVAVRTSRGLGAVTSLVSDHHGTPLAAVSNAGNPAVTPVKRLYTDPYGATRGTSTAATIPGDIQFLGKNRDTGTGLTLLDARYYDETVGGFISVDPVLDLTDPQQWNGYAYAGNNPLTYEDASGLLMLGKDDYSGYSARSQVTSSIGQGSTANELDTSVKPPVNSSTYVPLLPAVPTVKMPSVPTVEAPVGSIVGGRLFGAIFGWVPLVLMMGGSSTGSGIPADTADGAQASTAHSTPAQPDCPPDDVMCQFTGLPLKSVDDADEALGKLTAGGRAKASELESFGTNQGWIRSQTTNGPVKFTDSNGIVRLTIKRGSDRAPGSDMPHVEMRNWQGLRIDSYGNLVTRKSPGNHTPIKWDW